MDRQGRPRNCCRIARVRQFGFAGCKGVNSWFTCRDGALALFLSVAAAHAAKLDRDATTLQALEAGGARRLRNESFFTAPQLKRTPLGGGPSSGLQHSPAGSLSNRGRASVGRRKGRWRAIP